MYFKNKVLSHNRLSLALKKIKLKEIKIKLEIIRLIIQ